VTFDGRPVGTWPTWSCCTPWVPAVPPRLSLRVFFLETRMTGVQEAYGALSGFGAACNMRLPHALHSIIFS